ncbi:hypothetical protein GS597_03410 [Synechococcales cyanobacterium C]|uniref:Uncharacterized protein n=1 Tax=Petrachloros mirabilis ULC683 TaxID=2781853 RepID=A0A8K2ANE1_9CYAN|nr:hypothetical protein [Petrachloros mirabilis]NCJ05571.1 hypothetical protein [Petrachloros mirabilis ULC683]
MTVERWTDEMLDKLADSVVALRDDVVSLRDDVVSLRDDVKELRDESKEQSIRFNAYQQASQWVVNLAFGLLATATITTIVTAVMK